MTSVGDFGSVVKAPDGPAVAGMSFVGWATSPDGKASIMAGDEIQLTSDISIYAVYEPVQHTVTLSVSGRGAVNPGKSTTLVSHGMKVKLPDVEVKSGYELKGWSIDGSSLEKLKPGSEIAIESPMSLTAVIEPISYKIAYAADGAKIIGTMPLSYTVEDVSVSMPLAERDGFNFIGWRSMHWDGAKSSFDASLARDLEVSPAFEEKEYSVRFIDGLDGSIISSHKAKHGQSVREPAAPAHDGYAFARWDKAASKVTSDIDVIAIYEKASFKVRFVDGLTSSTIREVSAAFGEPAQEPPIPAFEGYNFVGWDKEFSSVTQDLTVTARYEAKKFTVSFDANGGSGSTASRVMEYGKEYTIDACSFKKPGYSFKGWALSPSGDARYAALSKVKNISSGADVKLYAVWAKDGGGSGSGSQNGHYETHAFCSACGRDLTATSQTFVTHVKSSRDCNDSYQYFDRVWVKD